MKFEITFKIAGRSFTGSLGKVSGAGASMWYLTVKNRHCGQLWHSPHCGWQFAANKYEGEPLGNYFASFLPEDIRNPDVVCNCFLCEKERARN
jgi:hypothetical protein